MRDVPWNDDEGWKPLDQVMRETREERLREERGTYLFALVLAVAWGLWLAFQLVRTVRLGIVALEHVTSARRGLEELKAERDAAGARSTAIPPTESIATESDSAPVEPIARA